MFNLVIGKRTFFASFLLRFISPPPVIYTWVLILAAFLQPDYEKFPLADAIQFPFLLSRTRREPSRHLVSNAIFFTRETSNFPSSPFFFVHCAEIAGALALPQLISRRVEARLSIGRW